MAHFQAQPRPMSPPCPPPSPRWEPYRGFGDVDPPVPPSCDMVYLGARLQMVSFLGLSDCSCTTEGRQCYFASNESTGHDFDGTDPSPGSASPHDDDDATVIDASSLVPSRWSEAETILENPAMYRDRIRSLNLKKHRISARSYQELWPSSPTSLAHTMPTASLSSTSPRKIRPSCPQPRTRTAQISPPKLDAASINAANFVSMSHSASESVNSWPELVPYCPNRKAPTQMEQSKFDAYSDEEDELAIDTNDRRERRTLGRFRRRVSSGFQNLLCRGG